MKNPCKLKRCKRPSVKKAECCYCCDYPDEKTINKLIKEHNEKTINKLIKEHSEIPLT